MEHLSTQSTFRYSRKLLIIITIIAMVLIKSCSIENLLEFNCSECYPDKPLDSWVKLHLSINEENTEVPITVYLGPPENEVIVLEEVASKETHYIYIENETVYTVVAKYKVDGRTRLVFNKIETKIFYDYESCNEPCYWVSGAIANMRIAN